MEKKHFIDWEIAYTKCKRKALVRYIWLLKSRLQSFWRPSTRSIALLPQKFARDGVESWEATYFRKPNFPYTDWTFKADSNLQYGQYHHDHVCLLPPLCEQVTDDILDEHCNTRSIRAAAPFHSFITGMYLSPRTARARLIYIGHKYSRTLACTRLVDSAIFTTELGDNSVFPIFSIICSPWTSSWNGARAIDSWWNSTCQLPDVPLQPNSIICRSRDTYLQLDCSIPWSRQIWRKGSSAFG